MRNKRQPSHRRTVSYPRSGIPNHGNGPGRPVERPPVRLADNRTPVSNQESPPGDVPTRPSKKGVSGSATPGFARSAALSISMVLLSRVTGFFRGTLLAYYFGQNRMTDAYGYAFTIPDVLWSLVAGGAMYAAFVPVITEYFSNNDEEGAWKTFSVVFTFLALVLTLILPLLWIFARPLLHVFAPDLANSDPAHPGLPAGTWLVNLHQHQVAIQPMDLAVHLTRIVIPAQMCFFLGSLLMGVQHSKKRFVIPFLGPVFYNVGMILGGVLLHSRLGIDGFAWGALCGALVGNVLIQVWGLHGLNPRFRPDLDLAFPGVKKCGKLVLPVILGISLPQVDQIINGYYVSALHGGRSILDYTNRLMQLPLGLFGQAIGMVILPTLSTHAAQKDTRQFKEMLSYGIRLALFLTVPAAVLMAMLAGPLITVVYQHGNFHASDTQAAIPTLILYAVGVPAWSAQAVIARAFYARQDTRTPVIIGTVVTALFFFLNGFLVNTLNLGVPGAALATTIAATLHCVVLFVLMWKRLRGLNPRPLVKSALRMTISSLVLAGVAYGISHVLPTGLKITVHGALLDLLLAGGLGAAAYLGVQVYLGADETSRFRDMIQRRKGKGR